MNNKIEISVSEYAKRENITDKAVYARIKTGTVDYIKTEQTHWKKPGYKIVVLKRPEEKDYFEFSLNKRVMSHDGAESFINAQKEYIDYIENK